MRLYGILERQKNIKKQNMKKGLLIILTILISRLTLNKNLQRCQWKNL